MVYPLVAGMLVGLVGVGLVGCGAGGDAGPPTAHLTGRVTIGGEELPKDADGTVIFQPASGGQAHPASAKIEGGRYECPNVPIGQVLAYFNISRLTGRMVSEDGGTPFPERENLVPVDNRQGVTVEVSADGEQNFDL